MSTSHRLWAVPLIVISAVPALAGTLDDYVVRPDPSYAWQERRSGRLDDVDWVELRLISQTWRGITWQHQLYLLRPRSATGDTRQALLFIGGGRWKAEYDQPPAADAALPSNADLFVDLARQLATPVAVLRQVPFQPIFGMREDDLIAHTFEQYFASGDADWPLLLPMVNSAVRAMDTVQEYAAASWDIGIEEFTVTGASKRGWTTWLTAAADSRVTAFAPMVIDMLNMQPQIEHQIDVWGSPSEQLEDYTSRGLHTLLDSDAGRALRAIVDPYSYRQRLVQPKLIVIATNDRYWPVDALNFYWQDLPAPKYVLYVPNDDHGLEQRAPVMAALQALHAHAGGRASLPALDWRFSEDGGALSLSVSADVEPDDVVAWVAKTRQRDFRDARWRAYRTRRDGERYTFELNPPRQGYAAVFAELSFEKPAPYRLSTGVRVVAGSGVTAAKTAPR